MASTFAGAVATGGIATKRRKLGAEKATIFSANSGAGLGDTKLVGDMSRAQSWNGGLLSYLARQAARGAALGRAQTLDGVAIGQMLGNGFYNIGMASAAYRKLDSSLDRAEEWAKRQGGADVGDIVDQQFYLESSITSGRYSGSTLKMLQDMRGQRLRFASRGSAVGADGETLARGFTAADGRRYLSTDQKGSLQQQLAGLVTRAHERERNGLKDGAWGQTVEGFRAVVTHAGMGSMLDGQFGSIYGRSWQSPLLRDEISSYRRGDMRALLGSTVNNYDHSGENWKIVDGKITDDGNFNLYAEDGSLILSESQLNNLLKTSHGRYILNKTIQEHGGSESQEVLYLMQEGNQRMREDVTQDNSPLGKALQAAYADGEMSYQEARNILKNHRDALNEESIIKNTGVHWGLRTVLNNNDQLRAMQSEIFRQLYGDTPIDERTIANAAKEITLNINGADVKFTKQSEKGTAYHNPEENVKLVGDDGTEIVINRNNGKLEMLPRYRGTFNFDPSPFNLNPFKGILNLSLNMINPFYKDHGDLDMLPYYVLGNDRLDSTSVGQRYSPKQNYDAFGQSPGYMPLLFPIGKHVNFIYPSSAKNKYQIYRRDKEYKYYSGDYYDGYDSIYW